MKSVAKPLNRGSWLRTAIVSGVVIGGCTWLMPAHAQTDVELREALDDTNLVWKVGNTFGPPWQFQTNMTHDGIDAAQAGPLQAGIVAELANIMTSVTGPGTLIFWWKLENAECFHLTFWIGSTLIAGRDLGGILSTNWDRQVFRIPLGPQALQWTFETSCGDGSPPGNAWLDEVSFVPDSLQTNSLAVLTLNAESLTLDLRAAPGARLQIQYSTNLISWDSFALPEPIQLPDGRATVTLRRPTLSIGFYRSVWVP